MQQKYKSIREKINDGDVLLFPRKKTFISGLISRVQGHRHTHVALAKWDGDRLKTREFREFKGYDERFVSMLGSFDHVATDFEWACDTDEFIDQVRFQKYSYFKALIAVFPIPFFGRGYICSEFVADVLEGQVNLPASPTPGDISNWFWEKDFAITKVNACVLMKNRGEIKVAYFNKYTEFKKPARRVKTVYLHCSAHDWPGFDNPETMDKWHRHRGWSGIGYHFYIDKSGQIFHGRLLHRIPAAQAPFNRRSIAICCGGLQVDKFTDPQLAALRRLCDDIDAAYDGEMVFRGHREVSPKTCPVFDYKSVLRLDKNGRIKDGVPTIKKLEASKSEHMKQAAKQITAGDVKIGIGGVAVANGVYEVAKDVQPLETLKNLTNTSLEYKSILLKANEVLAWLLTFEGMFMAGGAALVVWGWRSWVSANSIKKARLKDEPKIERLKREALEAYS